MIAPNGKIHKPRALQIFHDETRFFVLFINYFYSRARLISFSVAEAAANRLVSLISFFQASTLRKQSEMFDE